MLAVLKLVSKLGEMNVSAKESQTGPFPWVIVSSTVLAILFQNEEGSARWKLFTVQLAEK